MAAKKKASSKAKVTKTGLAVDLTGVEASERRGKRRIPEGTYLAKVDKVGPKKFSSGNRGIEWQYVVVDGNPKGKGYRAYNNNTFIDKNGDIMEQSLWALKGALQALEPRVKFKDSLMNIPFEKLTGRHVGIEVADDEDDNGKIRSQVIDVFHPSFLEDEEDEDEEEEPEDEDEEEWDEDAEEEEDEDDEAEEEDEEEADEEEEEWDLDEDEL